MRKTTIGVLFAAALLQGCTYMQAGVKKRAANYAANQPLFDAKDVEAFVDSQNEVMADFARLAGFASGASITEWRAVVDAGIHYTDVRCDRFMDSLFWLNRVREGTSRQIQHSGAAIGAALAVVEASKTAIGLTPLGFSLFDQTVDNLGDGLLYKLNPSTVRVLVEKKQAAYLESLSASYSNKVTALQVIQGYAAICLPPSIETEVERAINDREYAPRNSGTAAPADETPAVTTPSPPPPPPAPGEVGEATAAAAGEDAGPPPSPARDAIPDPEPQ